jgi:hypothetical protein
MLSAEIVPCRCRGGGKLEIDLKDFIETRDERKGGFWRDLWGFCMAARLAAGPFDKLRAGRIPTSFLVAHSHPPADASEAKKQQERFIE